MYLKVVNQFNEDIIVYLDNPPARKNERITARSFNLYGWKSRWDGWNGPTKTLRGQTFPGSGAGDPWCDRITIANNANPSLRKKPFMRIQGVDNKRKLGGFYVPVGWHLRVHLGQKGKPSGWFQNAGNCPQSACVGTGTSAWVTTANQYNREIREPLLLFETNVNAFNTNSNNPAEFENGGMWLDLSGVDGMNAHMEINYGNFKRRTFVPLFETKTRWSNLMMQ